MTDTAEVFLGITAFSVLVMALIQVGAIIAGLRVAKRVDQLARQLDQDIKPIIANLTTVSSEAARTAGLAARQVERVDQLLGDVAGRIDTTLTIAQAFVSGPARQGFAVVSGVRAAFEAFTHLRNASRRRQPARSSADDEESLFIG